MSLLWILAVVFLVMWAVGFGVFQVGGGLIHMLLILALVLVIIRVVQGRSI